MSIQYVGICTPNYPSRVSIRLASVDSVVARMRRHRILVFLEVYTVHASIFLLKGWMNVKNTWVVFLATE